MANDCAVVILAAGQGKRMHQAFPGVPKVLVPLAGKPMIHRMLDAVDHAGRASSVTVVVGPSVAERVKTSLAGRKVLYAIQPEPKGTAHAVLAARDVVPPSGHVLVLYGDHPLLSGATIRRVVERHARSGATVTMLTVTLPDFKEWRTAFADWGRIVRDAQGTFSRIVETKDATGAELRITEVNPAMYCFRAAWLWEHLPMVTSGNAQGELYLTDVPGMAVAQGEMVETVPADDPRELFAIVGSPLAECRLGLLHLGVGALPQGSGS